MIYAIRRRDVVPILVEFKSQKVLDQAASADTSSAYSAVSAASAHRWINVKAHRTHETGLYVDQGRIRYAHPEPKN